MEQLPPEVIIEYALILDFDSIISLCQTCSYLNAVCDTDHFWRRKTLRDLRELQGWPSGAQDYSSHNSEKISKKSELLTWKEHYHSWILLPIVGSVAENNLFYLEKVVPLTFYDCIWDPIPCVLLSKTELLSIIKRIQHFLKNPIELKDEDCLTQYCQTIQNGLRLLGHH
jgi:hypothetical protein